MIAKYSLRNSLLLLLFLLVGWMPQQAMAAPATHFVVSVPPTASAGALLTITVTAEDAANATDTTYAGTVHFTSSDPAATLPPDATLTNGTGSFPVTLDTSGGQTVTATDTTTPSITGTSGVVAVAPGPATIFLVTAPPSAGAGVPFSVSVTAKDQFGNTATGYAGTVHFTSTDTAAALPADTTLTNGAGTFPNGVILRTSGSQTVTATDTTTPSITGTSGAIAVSPGPAVDFSVTAPPTAVAGSPISISVTAKDQFGNTATSYGGTVHFTSSDLAAALPGDAPLTSGTGIFPATFKTSGIQTVTATDIATPSITGTSGSTAVSPGTTTHFNLSAPTSATAGTGFTVTVTAKDQFGNTTTGYPGTVHLTSTDTAAILPADTTLTNGVGTFTNGVTLKTSGSQTVTATDTTTPSITGTSNTILVTAGSATSFVVSVPATANAGTPFSVTVTAKDQFGNTATGYPGTVHFTSSDPAAVLPADTTLTNGVGTFTNGVTLKTSGSQTVTATDTTTPSITGTSSGTTVSPGPATIFVVGTPATTAAGIPFNVTVTAKDQFGNTATGYNSRQVTLTSTDPAVATLLANQTVTSGAGSFSVTLYTHGSWTVTATDTSSPPLTGTSSAIAVTSDAAIHFQVSAPLSATAGTGFTVTVTAKDQFGNTATGYTGKVVLSSTDTSAALPPNSTTGSPLPGDPLTAGVGTFAVTLNTAGTQTVTATDTSTSSLTGTSATILVNNVVPTISAVTPSTVTAGGPAFMLTVTNTDSSYIGSSLVNWNGAALTTMFVSSSTLTANVPASLIAAPGSANITVTTPGPGGGTSNIKTVTIAAQSPTVTSLSPSPATRGDTVTLIINGRNFQNGATVSVTSTIANGGSLTPTAIAFVSSTQLTATLPIPLTATTGAYNVQVTNPDGSKSPASAASTFTVNAQVVNVNSLTPSSTTVTTDNTAKLPVTVTGVGFRDNATVTFQGATPDTSGNKVTFTVPSTVNSSNQITATIAQNNVLGRVDTYTVQVTNPDGTPSPVVDAQNKPQPQTQFTVNPQSVQITSLSPNFATLGDTVTLTINGTNFFPGATVSVTSTIANGGSLTPTAIAFVSSTQLTATLPIPLTATTGAYNVQVTNPDGSKSPASAASTFTVNAQTINITSVVPPTVSVGDPTFALTINGNGFRPDSKVFFNAAPVPVVYVSSTQLTATIGGSDATTPLTELVGLAGAYNIQVKNPDNSLSNSILKVSPLRPASGITTFNSGIQLLSVPYDYDNDLVGPDATEGIFHYLGAVGATSGVLMKLTDVEPNISLAVWDPFTGIYALSTTANPPMTLSIGQGYWVRFPSGSNETNGLIRKGVPAQSVMRNGGLVFSGGSYPIALKQGWNMIGDPFTGQVLIGNLQVQFGDQSYNFTQAMNLGLISGVLYSYGVPSGSTTPQYIPQTNTKTLDPYVGYWILALQPCTLLVPQP